MQSEKDPIVAKASAPGRGGIGIIRVSGRQKDVEELITKLFPESPLKPRYAHLRNLVDKQGDLIDQTICIYFKSPKSYTGESVLEIQSHGGTAVLDRVLERLLEIGRGMNLRLANPGEFTERAFLNGRIDLAQAEAVADLIDAGSAQAARAAARSLEGVFSKKIEALNESLIELRSYVEATLDFPEDEVDFIAEGRVKEKIKALSDALSTVESQALRGKVLRDGLSVVLVGAPNVGKSSLMNALAGNDVAIVTDVAGTTRDRIEHEITIDGMLMKLTDTAGLRETDDKVESIGIRKTLEAVGNADVVIRLSEASFKNDDNDRKALALIAPRLREGVRFLNVVNKIDENPSYAGAKDEILVSALTGEGMERLIDALKSIAGANEPSQGDFLARTRHLECLVRTQEHLQVALQTVEAMSLDVTAEELRLAGLCLGEIVGETLPDDLLGKIFSTFCIGK